MSSRSMHCPDLCAKSWRATKAVAFDRVTLQLSGIQHYAFCPRQWALIHIEQQWEENDRTAVGRIMHDRAHNDLRYELRGDTLILRGLHVFSDQMGVSGTCDVVEFHRKDEGIALHGFEGTWFPYPVEYKRGEPKENDADRMQLCAQAMCLEEMLLCSIEEGSLFYGETRRRERVALTESLRLRVTDAFSQMHKLYAAGHTPKAKPRKGCNACSLKEICLPRLTSRTDVEAYIRKQMEGDT